MGAKRWTLVIIATLIFGGLLASYQNVEANLVLAQTNPVICKTSRDRKLAAGSSPDKIIFWALSRSVMGAERSNRQALFTIELARVELTLRLFYSKPTKKARFDALWAKAPDCAVSIA
jgi:hypothetical protein